MIVSKLMVCQSANGFYIGQLYVCNKDMNGGAKEGSECWQDHEASCTKDANGDPVVGRPSDRHSYEYYPSQETAQKALDNSTWNPR